MKETVYKWGAVGDGVHDDYAAIQAALDSGIGEVVIPQGIYCISRTLRVHSDTKITADRAAKLVMKSAERRRRNEFLLSNADTVEGNKNITITGGIWDGNNTAPENKKPDLFDRDGYSGAVLNFCGVDGLTLSDMVVANSVTFNIRMSRLHHFHIENIDFISDKFGVNQDGLHFGGDVKHGFIKNIRALSYGQTNDDLLAFNADDSVERVENLDLSRAAIEDVTVDTIYAENCHTLIRMLSVTAPIRNIRIKNVYGGFRCNAINADAARYCRTPLFCEEEHPAGVGEISNVQIENFSCIPVYSLADDFGGTKAVPRTAILLESLADEFHISGFRLLNASASMNPCCALYARHLFGEEICADGTVYRLDTGDEELSLADFTEICIRKQAKV